MSAAATQKPVRRGFSSGLGRGMVGLIRGYQRVSRWTPPVCRFSPTCSEYAAIAIGTHGPGRGLWLAALRLLKCHPFHPGGYDPVPGASVEGAVASAADEAGRASNADSANNVCEAGKACDGRREAR